MKATLIQEINGLIVYLVACLTSQRRIISNDTKPQKFDSTASADYTLKNFEKTRRGVQKKISMFSQSYLVAVLVWELLCISLWVEQISDHVFHQEKEDRGVRSVGLYKKS